MNKHDEYLDIINHYEGCFDKYGATHQGVDWPNEEDLARRYKVMLEVAQNSHGFSLLDFGCGCGFFLDYLYKEKLIEKIEYSGLDLGRSYVGHCIKKHPGHQFIQSDVLKEEFSLFFDFIVMNGVFTIKNSVSYERMLSYFKQLISKMFQHAKVGLAFNVMSTHVDWERKDLFHLSIGVLTDFLARHVSRHFIVRNDYGLYEYTVYIYHQPQF